jgi:NAD(P)-dependent dehydrogenase (short-subunit alcohol dehydrogenase family)
MARLDGKVAIVTGAAQGIGWSYARGLAEEGAKVIVADVLDPAPAVQRIEAAVQGATAIGQSCDVSDPAQAAALIKRATDEFGRLDVLVNNAAIFAKLKPSRTEDIDVEEWDRVMAVNLRGIFLCVKAAIPVMRAQGGGKIINIASDTPLKGVPMMLHYVTSKGGVIGLTRALARELGDDNIAVNCICPGLTMSEGVAASQEERAGNLERVRNMRAIKRDQVPEDLVGACLFLASSDSDFVTGQSVTVNGGDTLH